MNELLDRWLEVIEVERKTRAGYVGKIEKHIRPTIGRLQVGRVKAETIEGLYAQLRRCRDHCRGEKYIQHRTDGRARLRRAQTRRRCAQVTFQDPSAYCRWCERACRQHRCAPLSASSIRVVHAILSGAFRTGRPLGLDRRQPHRADRAATRPTAQPEPADRPGGRPRC